MESKDELYDFICLLQPTSPVRGKNSIDNAFQRFLTTESDSLLSVVEYNHFLWKDFDNPISLYNFNKRPMRQHKADEDRVYRENGSIYFFKVNSFKKYRNRLHKKISLFEMNEDERHEVDSNDDFIVIESILDKKNEL
jgi:CMP-N-acetylneuraminic acid synthetase